MARLIESFNQYSDKPIQETLDTINALVSDFTQRPNQQDDITILGFEIS